MANQNWVDFTLSCDQGSTAAAKDGELLCPLNSFAALAVGGADQLTFLQSQVTFDITEISDQKAAQGSLCDAKGRVVANFVALAYQDQVILIVPQDMCEIALKHIKKYAMFSKVSITEVTEQWFFCGFQAKSPTTDSVPFRQTDQAGIIQIEYPGKPGFSLLLSQDAALLIHYCQTAKQNGATLVNGNWWQLQMINAGLAVVHPTTSGLFTPQMLSLEKFSGVSFSKGCYLGQEIIARTQHLGKLKRHLYQLRFDGDCPSTGEPIYNTDDKPVGTVINAIKSGTHILALGVIEDRALKEGEVFIKGRGVESVIPPVIYGP